MHARTLIITDPARSDLDDIYDHIAKDSPANAERFIKAIVTGLHLIARNGTTGAARDWISPGLRVHVHGNYCAYFRVDNGNLVVQRVVHSARDVNLIFVDPDRP